MFVHVVPVGMMEMSVVEVVHMTIVHDGGVTAVRSVVVIVVGVLVAAHLSFLLLSLIHI